jgi:PAS domain S-box-containing protein
MLVDDVQENLELLEDVLNDHGYATVMARNGVEALNQLRESSVDIIVADAMMPKMDGFQLCKEVRALPSCARVPFIIYTGNYVDDSDQEFARSIGVDRYVVKYSGLGPLVDSINELAQERYGRAPEEIELHDKPEEDQGQIDDQAFLEKHHAIIIKKLEEKMVELEMYAETLVQKNREIQASEDRYRTLFDHASIAIFVVDHATGKPLQVNRAGLTLLGYSKDELLAMPALPFADDSSFPRDFMQSAAYASAESALRRSDGTVLAVEVGVGPVTRPQDTRVLLFVRDITEQKRMREHLMQFEKMALMGRLAAGIAHEIRNPLSAISLNLQYLGLKLGPHAEVADSLKDALEGARRVEAVIENTLNLARVTPPVLEVQQVNDLVTQVLGFLKISGRQKNIQFEASLAEDLPPIHVDAKQVQQVILNVVQNAVDASPQQGVVVLRTAAEDVPDDGGRPERRVVVSVRDHGPGISPEARKRMFEQFYTTKAGGTGLGLALSRQIMERHHGDIVLDNADGGGTIVRLIFPMNS